MKILMVIDSRFQSGSWWRSTGPLAALSKKMDIQMMYQPVEHLRWIDVVSADVVFMHRPFHPEHKRVYDLAKSYQVPLWLDYDDLLTQIPLDNETEDIYMMPDNIDRVIKMILHADVVSVSTNEMKRQLDKWRPLKDCVVVKNAYPKKWWHWRDLPQYKKHPVKRVMWRGSKHHQKDLLHVKDDIIRVAKKFPDMEFAFIGWKPWYILEDTENCFSVGPCEVTDYFHNLRGINPDVVMVPLADSTFNRCKSNIAMIEGAMAGGLVVAPKWEEWAVPGVMNYESLADTMEQACEKAMSDTHLEEAEQTWKYVQEYFELERWNKKRAVILNKLVKPDVLANEDNFQGMVRMDRSFTGPDTAQELRASSSNLFGRGKGAEASQSLT